MGFVTTSQKHVVVFNGARKKRSGRKRWKMGVINKGLGAEGTGQKS